MDERSPHDVVLKNLEVLTKRLQLSKEVEPLLQKFKMEKWMALEATATANELVLLALDRIKNQVTDYDVFIRMLKSMPGVEPIAVQMIATTSATDSEQSLKPATSDDTQPQLAVAIRITSATEVKATILRLERMFADLITTTRLAMCDKESCDRMFLERFRDYLLVLPVAKKAIHVKFFRESEDDILEAKNIQKLFAILSRYWSYNNYEILLKITVWFCDESLQASMQEYCKMLEGFEKSTTVDIYISAVPLKEQQKQLKDVFSTIFIQMDKPSSECTLHEIRMLNEAIVLESYLKFHSIYISSVASKCVVVGLRFPTSAVGWVLAAMTPNFMTTHLLTEVTMDGKCLTIMTEHMDVLNRQLYDASGAGDLVRVASLLNSGADMEAVGGYWSGTPLDTASEHGSIHVMRLLLQRGANRESRDEDGYTPLITAAWKGKCDVMIELLNDGAVINAQSNGGWSALMRVAYYGHTETVAELVKAGADMNLQNLDGNSALMLAAYMGRTETVAELLKAGADLNLQNKRGDSAVMRATVEHRSGALRELVKSEADLNLQNEEGLTALMVTSRSGRHGLTDILLTGPHIDVDIQENTTNWSALFFSAERGDVTTTQSLLKAGANPHLTDKNGFTALEVAEASDESDNKVWDEKEYDRFTGQYRIVRHDIGGVVKLLSGYIEDSKTSTLRSQSETSGTEQDNTPALQDSSQDTITETSGTEQDNTPALQDSSQDTITETSGTEQDSTPALQDSSQVIATSGRRMVTQAQRNMVNRLGKRIQKIFNQLERRLKSSDLKEHSKVGGEGRGDVQGKQKMKSKGKGPHDRETSSTSNTVSV